MTVSVEETIRENVLNAFQKGCLRNELERSSAIQQLNKTFSVNNNSTTAELASLRTSAIEFLLHGCIDRILSCEKFPKENYILKFLCKWLPIAPDDVFSACVTHLLKRCEVTNKSVRSLSCQIISEAMQNLAAEREIDEDLILAMKSVLQQRLRDKISSVRLWAIHALQKFQNPYDDDDDDSVIDEMRKIMSCDASADVRIAAIETIVICKKTLASIVNRVKDVKPEVRVAVLNRIFKDIQDVRHVPKGLKVLLVQYGVNDRNEEVKNAAKSLFLGWLRQMKYNTPRLLSQVGLDTPEADSLARMLLDAALTGDNNDSDLKSAISDQSLDWSMRLEECSTAELFWTLKRCEFHQSSSSAMHTEYLERLLPDTTQLCDLLQEAFRELTYQENMDRKALAQLHMKIFFLLNISGFSDAADEAGRSLLSLLCRSMLNDVELPERVILSGLKIAVQMSSCDSVVDDVIDLAQRMWSASFIPNEQLDDGEDEEKLTERMNKLIRAGELAVWSLQQALGASECLKEKVFILRSLIDKALVQPMPELRALGMHGLGLLGLIRCEESDALERGVVLEKDRAAPDVYEYSRQVALQTVTLDDEDPSIRSLALQTLSDMALVRPSSLTDGALLQVLIRLLDTQTQEPEVLCAAAEAASKLLFNGVLQDPLLFAKLLLLFFQTEFFVVQESDEDQEDGDDELSRRKCRLQQQLNVFFKGFFKAGSGREQVAILSTVELVSQVVSRVRDDEAEVSSLIQIINHLTFLSKSVTAFRPSDKNLSELFAQSSKEAPKPEDQTRRCVCLCAMISLMREVLKLGSGVIDRALSKELVKVVSALSQLPLDWISETLAIPLLEIFQCARKRLAFDKDSVKTIDKLVSACDAARPAGAVAGSVEESPQSFLSRRMNDTLDTSCAFNLHPLYQLVPGLVDLMSCNESSEPRRFSGERRLSDQSQATNKRAEAKRPKKSNPAQVVTDAVSPTTASPSNKKSRIVTPQLSSRSKIPKRTPMSRLADKAAIDSPEGLTRSPRMKKDRAGIEARTGASTSKGDGLGLRASSRIAGIPKPTYYAGDWSEDDDDEEGEGNNDVVE